MSVPPLPPRASSPVYPPQPVHPVHAGYAPPPQPGYAPPQPGYVPPPQPGYAPPPQPGYAPPPQPGYPPPVPAQHGYAAPPPVPAQHGYAAPPPVPAQHGYAAPPPVQHLQPQAPPPVVRNQAPPPVPRSTSPFSQPPVANQPPPPPRTQTPQVGQYQAPLPVPHQPPPGDPHLYQPDPYQPGPPTGPKPPAFKNTYESRSTLSTVQPKISPALQQQKQQGYVADWDAELKPDYDIGPPYCYFTMPPETPLMPSMQRYVVLVIGDQGVGKSCLMNRIVNGVFVPDYIPTFDVQVWRAWPVVSGKTVEIEFWDCPWKLPCDPNRIQLYRKAAVFLFVYNSLDRNSWDSVQKKWAFELKLNAVLQKPVVVAGTFAELTKQAATDRRPFVGTKEAHDAVIAFEWVKAVPVSCENGFGIAELVEKVAHTCVYPPTMIKTQFDKSMSSKGKGNSGYESRSTKPKDERGILGKIGIGEKKKDPLTGKPMK